MGHIKKNLKKKKKDKAAGLPSTLGALPYRWKKQGKVAVPGNNRSDESCSLRIMKHINHSVILLLDRTSAKVPSRLAREPDVVPSPFWLKGSRQRQLLRGQETWLYLSLCLGDGRQVTVKYINYERGIVSANKITPGASPSYLVLVKSTYGCTMPKVSHFKQNFLWYSTKACLLIYKESIRNAFK